MVETKNCDSSIKIDLDRSDNNGTVTMDELVQRRCYDQLAAQIQSDLKKVFSSLSFPDGENCLSERYPPGSGLVYFIDGTRGAGKSTFLRAAYEALPNGHARLIQLAYIDPSRIEASEIILLGILKSVAEKVELRLQKMPRVRDEKDYKFFRNTFKKLAGGLSLFAEDHHQLKYLDPELFLDHGLERARDSKDLRRHLHSLFDTACKILEVEGLVLAIDDADTNSTHARSVLECIRNYLDTPRLVILVTGDMELYSLLVRDHFFENLGHSKHDLGEERRKQRVRMVDHLEDQYLLKLFPIRRRVQLRPLWNLLERSGTVYRLQHESWDSPRNPKIVVDELIRRGLRVKVGSDVALYHEFLLKQPLRSVLQVLSRCAPHLKESDEVGVKCNLWTSQHPGEELEPMLSEALRESLRAMALGSLYKFGVDVDAIAAQELPALIDAVFELSIRDGDLDTAAYLRPQPSEENLKSCFPALAADVANLCAQSPSAVIRYMLGGPGSVSLYGQVDLHNSRALETKALHWQFRQYMGIGRKEDALNWARHATAVLIAPGVVNSALVRFGVIGLHMRKPKGKLLGPVENFRPIKNALNAWIYSGPNASSAQGDQQAVKKMEKPLPAFAFALVEISGSGNRTYASIFNILGIIERLLGLEKSSQGSYDVLTVLPKTYPPLSISCPPWEGNSPLLYDEVVPRSKDDKNGKVAKPHEILVENDEDLDSAGDEAASFQDTPHFMRSLALNLNRWLTATSGSRLEITPSAVLMGKIWTRLYFSLEKVSDNRRGKICSASLMELFALCLINAFYVEETDHHLLSNLGEVTHDRNLDRTNPLTSPASFYRKLLIIADKRADLPLTYLIATCPLILGLLHPKEAQPSVEYLLKSVVRQNELPLTAQSVLCDPDAWDLIERSFIHGVNWSSSSTNDSVIEALIDQLPKPRFVEQKNAADTAETASEQTR